MAFQHFLLVYDLARQELVRQLEFHDGDEAAAAYRELEGEYRGRSDLEIVLVGADSIETIKQTHAHYFERVASSSPYLAGV
jgi:chromosome segregation and condensation protein ScpB